MPIPLTDALTVLIVDDSPEDRITFLRYLTRESPRVYVIEEAETLAEGVERYRDLQPDCVIRDLRLPDGDGTEFFDALLATGLTPPLPVIVTTGEGNEEVAVDVLRRGAADYLVKGKVSPQRLRTAIEQTAERVRAARQVAELRRALAFRAERERRESEDRWLRLVEHLPDAVLIIDEGELVRYANPAAAALVGTASADALVGEPLLLRFSAADRREVRRLWERARAHTAPIAARGEASLMLTPAEGPPIAVDHFAAPVFYAGQPALQVVLRTCVEPTPAAADTLAD